MVLTYAEGVGRPDVLKSEGVGTPLLLTPTHPFCVENLEREHDSLCHQLRKNDVLRSLSTKEKKDAAAIGIKSSLRG
jgi:hypothetical protein